jgi:hypothetical protein
MLAAISRGTSMLISAWFAAALALTPSTAAAHLESAIPGARAGDPKVVTLATPADVHEPQAAVDAKGRVFVVYASTELVSMSVSNDAGASFGAPVAVGRIGKIAVGMRRGPRVVATPTAVVVSAIGGARGGGNDGDLVAWRSTTGGVSWGAPARVSDLPGSAREGLHAMAAGAKGEVACAWIDVRSGKAEIYCALSSDDGQSFGANRLVYHSPDGSVCECCHPSVAIDAQGVLYVMFRNQLDGARDMYITDSKDGGKTFSTARRLGTGTWKIAACPMDGGALAIDPEGRVASIWRREATIYRSEIAGSEVSEHELAPGEQPWIAASGRGLFTTWLAKRGGELWVLAPRTSTPAKLADEASDPMLAGPSDGSTPLIAVWESTSKGSPGLRVARLDHEATAVKAKDD